MISYLKNMSPEQKRKYLYAAATIACVAYATWEAHGRNWRATGIALVTAAITKLAHANVNDPAAAAAQQPIFTVTSTLVGPDSSPEDDPSSGEAEEAPAA